MYKLSFFYKSVTDTYTYESQYIIQNSSFYKSSSEISMSNWKKRQEWVVVPQFS